LAAVAEKKKTSTMREYYESLLIVLILVNFVRIFVFQTFKIPTPSMVDNLLVGDHLVVNKFIYGPKGSPGLDRLLGLRDVRRGDIIVFRFPRQPEVDYVKRVIGLPGDTVMVRDKKVSINGALLYQPYAYFADSTVYPNDPSLPEPYRSRDQFGPVRVPDGTYFAMGDNRDFSYDSRYWGTVPRELIKGKPVLVYWSFRGEPPPQGSPPIERVKELAGVAIHFFTRTRWDRMFFVVDSRYHYHSEPQENASVSDEQ
jgi:signal peptidase I